MNKKIYLHAQFFKEEDEVEKAREFKKLFPNAIVKKFIIAHEGVTNSKVVGIGNKLFKWSRNVIHNFFTKLKKGIQVIKGHTIDGIVRSEKVLGEIIDYYITEINNKKAIAALVGIYDKNDSDYNTISAELNVETDDSEILDISNIDRFALGKYEEGDIPAFEHAKEIAVVHCFTNNKIFNNEVSKMEENKIGFSDVKKFIREHNVFPTQLYSIEELVGKPKYENGDLVFYGAIDDRIVSYLSRNLDYKKVVEELESLKKDKEELEKYKEELNSYKEKFIKEEFRNKVLEKAESKKLSEKLKKYLTFSLDSFNGKVEDLEKDSESFIESKAKEFSSISSIVGEPTSPPKRAEHTLEGEPPRQKSEFDDQF